MYAQFYGVSGHKLADTTLKVHQKYIEEDDDRGNDNPEAAVDDVDLDDPEVHQQNHMAARDLYNDLYHWEQELRAEWSTVNVNNANLLSRMAAIEHEHEQAKENFNLVSLSRTSSQCGCS